MVIFASTPILDLLHHFIPAVSCLLLSSCCLPTCPCIGLSNDAIPSGTSYGSDIFDSPITVITGPDKWHRSKATEECS